MTQIIEEELVFQFEDLGKNFEWSKQAIQIT